MVIFLVAHFHLFLPLRILLIRENFNRKSPGLIKIIKVFCFRLLIQQMKIFFSFFGRVFTSHPRFLQHNTILPSYPSKLPPPPKILPLKTQNSQQSIIYNKNWMTELNYAIKTDDNLQKRRPKKTETREK